MAEASLAALTMASITVPRMDERFVGNEHSHSSHLAERGFGLSVRAFPAGWAPL